MRATLIKLMTVVLIAAAAPMAKAQDSLEARQVESWYERYLGRVAEPYGLSTHVALLCQGNAPVAVEASILSSQEYFDRNGCNDVGFVAALYRDVLGVAAAPQQIGQSVHRLQRIGNRAAFTLEFLQCNRGVAPVPVAPVAVQTYRPYYIAPAPVYRPTVVPAPIYRPAYGYGRPTPYGPSIAVGVQQPNFGFGVAIR